MKTWYDPTPDLRLVFDDVAQVAIWEKGLPESTVFFYDDRKARAMVGALIAVQERALPDREHIALSWLRRWLDAWDARR